MKRVDAVILAVLILLPPVVYADAPGPVDDIQPAAAATPAPQIQPPPAPAAAPLPSAAPADQVQKAITDLEKASQPAPPAKHYFRLLNPHHLVIGAGFLIAPKTPLQTSSVVDLALITHSTQDGTIIPQSWQDWLPPESWVPLQVGFGGSFAGDAVGAIGTSANIAPIVASTLLHGVDKSSSGAAQAVKTALAGSDNGGIRLGGEVAGQICKGGTLQSAKEAFPGRGIGEILGNAARVDFGYAWKF